MAPPQFIFRFLLPQIEKKELQGCRFIQKHVDNTLPSAPIALILPAIGCRIVEQTRKDG